MFVIRLRYSDVLRIIHTVRVRQRQNDITIEVYVAVEVAEVTSVPCDQISICYWARIIACIKNQIPKCPRQMLSHRVNGPLLTLTDNDHYRKATRIA